MTLSSKDQFDGLMKLKKEIELIQFLKELDNQFKNLNNQFKKSVYEESELTDQIETYLPELLPITVSAEMITIPSTTANGILFNIISNEIDFVLLYNINKNTFDGIRAS